MSKVEPGLRASQDDALFLLRGYRRRPTPEGRLVLMVAAGLLREVTHAVKRRPSAIVQVDREGRFVRGSVRF